MDSLVDAYAVAGPAANAIITPVTITATSINIRRLTVFPAFLYFVLQFRELGTQMASKLKPRIRAWLSAYL